MAPEADNDVICWIDRADLSSGEKNLDHFLFVDPGYTECKKCRGEQQENESSGRGSGIQIATVSWTERSHGRCIYGRFRRVADLSAACRAPGVIFPLLRRSLR